MDKNKNLNKIVVILFGILFLSVCFSFIEKGRENISFSQHCSGLTIKPIVDEHKDVDASIHSLTMAEASVILWMIFCVLEILSRIVLPNESFKIDRMPKFRFQTARSKIPDIFSNKRLKKY